MPTRKHQRRLEPVLVVSDLHAPYFDRAAFDLLLQVGKALRPKHIYIIGDFVDFYAVSSHSKNPQRSLKLIDELRIAEKCLDAVEAVATPGCKKTYIGGNHEDRLTRYLMDKAPELFDVVGIPELLHLKERGWAYVPYKHDIELGKLHLTHDVGVAGRNAVFQCLDTYQHSVVTGHTHRLAYIVEGNATGEQKLSAQFGWLGDASQIDYMHRAKVLKNWALGFGVGYFDPNSDYVYLQPVPIVNYTCLFNGQVYRAE